MNQNSFSKRTRWLLGGMFLVGVAGFCFPAIIARTSIRDRLLNAVVGAPHLSITSKAASLGWLSAATVSGLNVEGRRHRFRLEVDGVAAEQAWPLLLRDSPDLGLIRVDSPRIWMKFPLGERGAFSPIAVPRFSATIQDASLTVEQDRLEEPVIAVSGIDLVTHLRQTESGLVLSVDPLELYRHEPVTPQRCDQLLGFIAPSLRDAADVEGEFSMELKEFRIPVAVAEKDALNGLLARGEVDLHEVSLQSDNKLLRTLAKLVSDIHQTAVPDKTRVVKDSLIQFDVHDGRVHCDGLRFGFPDIDPSLEITAGGSVGFDRSLDITVNVPRLDPEKRQQRGPVVCRVSGSVQHPEFSAEDASLVVRIPGRATPLVDVDGVDLSARVETTSHGPVMVFDPMSLLDHESLDQRLASSLFHLLEPDWAYSPQLDGEVSLSIDALRVPLGEPETWLDALEMNGILVVHQAVSHAKTPIRQALVKLVADLYSKTPSETVRLAHDAEVSFHLRDGRFHFEGLRAGLPDLDPQLVVTVGGSIGIDETLDMRIQVPRLDTDKQAKRGPVRCYLTGSVSKPVLSAEDASLVVHLPDRTVPLIDVDGVDFTVRMDERQGRRVIAVDPVEVLKREPIDKTLAEGLLNLVDPALQYAPEIVGEVSLSIDQLRIPVGQPDAQWLSALEMKGTLTIHEASSLAQSPLRVAVAKLLADLYSIELEESIRVVHDATIDFDLRDNRFQFRGLRIGFPEIDPDLQIDIQGSVGLDQTLDLQIEFPRLDARKRQTGQVTLCRITGTVSEPDLSVTNAALVVRLPGHEQALLDVEQIDFEMAIRFEEEQPILRLDPVKVFDHRRVSTQRSEEWLRLIAPALAEVVDADGEFSLSLNTMRIPLSGSPRNTLRSTEFDGELELHRVTTRIQTPLISALVKVLADRFDKTPAETIRVAKDTLIQFEYTDGRLTHSGFQFGFPDWSSELTCRSSGSVGLDGSLDLILEVPKILTDRRKDESGKIRFKVSGTVEQPRVEEMKG